MPFTEETACGPAKPARTADARTVTIGAHIGFVGNVAEAVIGDRDGARRAGALGRQRLGHYAVEIVASTLARKHGFGNPIKIAFSIISINRNADRSRQDRYNVCLVLIDVRYQ